MESFLHNSHENPKRPPNSDPHIMRFQVRNPDLDAPSPFPLSPHAPDLLLPAYSP